jgi:SAM-dependent methyltransferase
VIAEPIAPEKFDEAVKSYWESPRTVSIIDKNLHELEIATVLRHLQATDYVADIGCGNGQATLRYAKRARKVLAIERSNHLRAQAQHAAEQAGISNVELVPGDVLDLSEYEQTFDAIVSQRMLINLSSWEQQAKGLQNLHCALKPGGRLIMIENTNDAFSNMNDMRHDVGLDAVPQHWHNRFFDFDQMMEFMQGRFQFIRSYDFGLYYFLTRVYVPMFASFKGHGANAVKDPIFEQSDAAARKVFELFGDRIQVQGGRAFGPIQGFVFRREA